MFMKIQELRANRSEGKESLGRAGTASHVLPRRFTRPVVSQFDDVAAS
jgi:hypothetical protein